MARCWWALQFSLYLHKSRARFFEVRGIVAALLLHGFELAAVIGALAGRAFADLFGCFAPLAHGYEELFALVDGFDAAIEFKARFLHGLLGFGQGEARLFELGLAAGEAGIAFFGCLAERGEFVLQGIDLGAEGEEALATQAHVELVQFSFEFAVAARAAHLAAEIVNLAFDLGDDVFNPL